MSPKHRTIKSTVEVESIDIPTMYEMSEHNYREFLRHDGLTFVDHHGVLRSTPAEYPIATTQEQLDILIDELRRRRNKLQPRTAS
jgi:hypothetical protein